MHKRASVLWLCPVLLCLLCGDARAHKIKLFATGEGRAIAGYVYFPGGGRARGVTVQALARWARAEARRGRRARSAPWRSRGKWETPFPVFAARGSV